MSGDRSEDAWFRDLADACGHGLLAVDPDCRILYANPAAARILSSGNTTLLGRDLRGSICPDCIAPFCRSLREALDGATVNAGCMASNPACAISRLGMTLSQIRDTRQVMVSLRDEGDIREREHSLQLAQGLAHMGSWTLNPATGEAWWSDETFRILGYPPGAITPSFEACVKRLHPEDRERVVDALQGAAATTGNLPPIEFMLIRPDGEIRHVRANGLSLPIAGSGEMRMIGSILDQTEQKRTEQALQKRNAEFEALLSNLKCIVARVDRSGRYLYVNPAVRQYGLLPDEVIGRTSAELGLVPETSVDEIRSAIEQVFVSGKPAEIHYGAGIAADRHCFDTRLYPECDADGTIRSVVGIAVDVTRRQAAEDAWREAEARWQFALSGAGDAVWDADLKSGRTYFSARWREMLGYEAKETMADPNQEWRTRLHPDDTEQALDIVRRHLHGETPHYACRFRLRCRGGSYKWFLTRGKVVARDSSGMPVRMIGTMTDLSQWTALEAALDETRWRFEQLAGAVPDAFWIYGLEGEQAFYLSPGFETLFEMDRQLAYRDPRSLVEAVHPEDRPQLLSVVAALRAREVPFDIEHRLLTPGGTLKWVRARAWPIRRPPDRVAIIGITEDITNRKTAELSLQTLRDSLEQQVLRRTAELQHANDQLRAQIAERERLETELRRRQQELERFARLDLISGIASGLAHELSQPLAGAQYALAGCVRLASDDRLSTSEGIQAMTEAHTQILRTVQIIRHISLLSRHRTAQVSSIHVGRLLQDVSALMKLSASESSIALELSAADDLPLLQADRVHIQQILLNLIRNAEESLRAAPPAAPRVSVGAGRRGGAMEFFVRDNGAGFEPSALERAFEPFVTSKPEGTGLGLAICQSIVQGYGGSISASNNAEGGATVRFTIPISP